MKERISIDLVDLIEYINYGDIYPIKKFIKACRKAKLDHTAGVGWPVFEKDKYPLVGDNCAIWLNADGIPLISIQSIYDKQIETVLLEDFQKINKNVLGVLWIDRAFDIS